LFFIGLVSLAFSQLVQNESNSATPEDRIELISNKISELKKRLSDVHIDQSGSQFDLTKRSATGNLRQLSNSGDKRLDIESLSKKLDQTNNQWISRRNEIQNVTSSVQERLEESEIIFSDLKENFASRLEEASPALEVLQESLLRVETEVDAVVSLSQKSLSDAIESYTAIQSDSNLLLSDAVPNISNILDDKPALRISSSGVRSKVASSDKTVPLDLSSRV
jgi:acyl transferase domain-containing protein